MQIAFCLISWEEAALEEIPETTALLKSSHVSREMEKSMVFWGAGGWQTEHSVTKSLGYLQVVGHRDAVGKGILWSNVCQVKPPEDKAQAGRSASASREAQLQTRWRAGVGGGVSAFFLPHPNRRGKNEGTLPPSGHGW